MSEVIDIDHQTLGLIGLGLLGSAIAERLIESGFSVRGFDLDRSRQDWLVSRGGQSAADAGQVFADCPTVLLSLPNSDVVHDLIAEHVAELREGQIFVDTTTGHPEQMRSIAAMLQMRNVEYVEATVAGSSRQMQAGEANLFLGGNPNTVSALKRLWSILGKQCFHLGSVGTASQFKLVHNLVLGLQRAVLAEGLTFARSLGFDPANVLDVLRQTPAASAVMDVKGRKMVDRDWQPEAKLSQHLKDVRLILSLAEDTKTPTPLSRVHRDLLERAVQAGFGDADNSAILEAFGPPHDEA